MYFSSNNSDSKLSYDYVTIFKNTQIIKKDLGIDISNSDKKDIRKLVRNGLDMIQSDISKNTLDNNKKQSINLFLSHFVLKGQAALSSKYGINNKDLELEKKEITKK